jgi:hypothetical protein
MPRLRPCLHARAPIVSPTPEIEAPTKLDADKLKGIEPSTSRLPGRFSAMNAIRTHALVDRWRWPLGPLVLYVLGTRPSAASHLRA